MPLENSLVWGICTPSSVKGTRWIPHVHRALSTLLKSEKNGDLAADSGQYAVTFHHMEHLATSAASADILGRAKKVSFIIYCTCYFPKVEMKKFSKLDKKGKAGNEFLHIQSFPGCCLSRTGYTQLHPSKE